MPSQVSHQSALQGTYAARVYVSPLLGDLVLVGEVSSTPSAESALNIAYTTTSGDAADVRAGMRVVITTSSGGYKGTLTVRHAGTLSSTHRPVREFSYGSVQVEAGDVVTVYNDFQLVDKLVSGDETFSPDHEAYADQNGDSAPPIVCSGGWFAGWLDSDGERDIPFYGADIEQANFDAADTETHAWTASGGAFDDDTAVSPTLTVDAPGYYLVEHTTTSDNHGTSATQYIPVRLHDDSDPPLECVLSAL